jgi:hypothetical protein
MSKLPPLRHVYFNRNDEMWLRAKLGTKSKHEYRPFPVNAVELDDRFLTWQGEYDKREYERVEPPADADERLAKLQDRAKPVQHKFYQCSYRYPDGRLCGACPEPQRRRDPNYCGEHQPNGTIRVCMHDWSLLVECAACGSERTGIRAMLVDREKPARRTRR